MNVRECKVSDKKRWIELYRAFLDELSDEGYSNESNQIDDQQIQNTFESALAHSELITLFVIEEFGNSIGFVNCMTIFDVSEQGKAFLIDDLFLSKDFRCIGFEKAIIKFIEIYAKNLGYNKVQLFSELSNTRSHRFYSKPKYNMSLHDIFFI